jgi:hypothetical protein
MLSQDEIHSVNKAQPIHWMDPVIHFLESKERYFQVHLEKLVEKQLTLSDFKRMMVSSFQSTSKY